MIEPVIANHILKGDEHMSFFKTILEFLFGIGVLINTAVYIPQAIRLIRAKHAREISLLTFSAFNIFLAIQLVYAYLNHDIHFFLGSLLIFCSSITVTGLIIYFRIKNNQLKSSYVKLSIMMMMLLMLLIILLNKNQSVHYFFTTYFIHIAYGAVFLWTVFAAFPQITTLLRLKDSSELSLITFLGFNFIQIVTVFHAYFYREWLLLAGVSLFLIVYAFISFLIAYYRLRAGDKNTSKQFCTD